MPYLDLIRPQPAAEPDDEQTKEPPVEAAADGWDREMRAAFAPIRHDPPPGCIAATVCGRIGPCDRHRAGRSCEAQA